MDLKTKIEILRQHETYCYQICYCLIQDESCCMQAAQEALLEVAGDPTFFSDTEERQKQKVKFAAVRSTLRIDSLLKS